MATRLTNSYLKNFEYAGKQVRLYDSAEQGLVVVIGVKKKSFSVYVKVDGKRRYEALGYFPEMTVEEAREKARKTKKALREGLVLVETLGELAEAYFKRRVGEVAEITLKRYRADWDSKFEEWHKLRPEALTVDRCRVKFGALTEAHGPIAANTAAIACQVIINWSISQGLLPLSYANPWQYVSRNPRKPRVRFMSSEELSSYWEGLEQVQSGGRRWIMALHALRYLLMTGRRKDEALSLRWEQLDLEMAMVTQPTKTGEKTFRLAREVVEHLQNIPKVKGCDFVFASFGRANSPIDEHTLYGAHKDICDRAGIKDLQIHDLRRTVGSHLRLSGVGLADIADILGHSDLTTTRRHYAHLDGASHQDKVEVVAALMKQK
ncbi:Site-specific recombinase XerD [Pseudovibrio denitrificans]|uniref:Site-specific recombinase XerD n=1 Tax=Pseudovibrio denitrificans TaxID=258256 RepID=A0A1I6Y2A7_9HYPH|nr:site-specific integrase [Pseudovibrio denitrificans]SFT44244.1 Site-specific recombinase XerD [Pseudovibrio denitrificans]